jgi:hypothetical protein
MLVLSLQRLLNDGVGGRWERGRGEVGKNFGGREEAEKN